MRHFNQFICLRSQLVLICLLDVVCHSLSKQVVQQTETSASKLLMVQWDAFTSALLREQVLCLNIWTGGIA